MLGMTAAVPVLALLGGCTDGPDVAEAWLDPGRGESDIRRWALAHAILTPNPHNKQPWLVQMVGTDQLILRPDLTRLLPATDPFNRQITVGCGAFLELLAMAAAEKGWRVDTTLWPEGEPQPQLDSRPIATVSFVRDAAVKPDTLFRHLLTRRTNRTVYDDARTPAATALAALLTAARPMVKAGATADPAQRDRLRHMRQSGHDSLDHDDADPAGKAGHSRFLAHRTRARHCLLDHAAPAHLAHVLREVAEAHAPIDRDLALVGLLLLHDHAEER